MDKIEWIVESLSDIVIRTFIAFGLAVILCAGVIIIALALVLVLCVAFIKCFFRIVYFACRGARVSEDISSDIDFSEAYSYAMEPLDIKINIGME